MNKVSIAGRVFPASPSEQLPAHGASYRPPRRMQLRDGKAIVAQSAVRMTGHPTCLQEPLPTRCSRSSLFCREKSTAIFRRGNFLMVLELPSESGIVPHSTLFGPLPQRISASMALLVIERNILSAGWRISQQTRRFDFSTSTRIPVHKLSRLFRTECCRSIVPTMRDRKQEVGK